MPISSSRWFRRSAELVERDLVSRVPRKTRGFYTLLRKGKRGFDVLYVGIAAGAASGMQGRLRSHSRKKSDWTHFSVFEVWDNIRQDEVRELEGLIRHIYRHDATANKLNVQRGHKPLKKLPSLPIYP